MGNITSMFIQYKCIFKYHYYIKKKIINKKQAAGLVFYLPAACLHVSYSAASSFLMKLL